MKHLYYMRHGQSLANVNDRFGSRPGAPDDLGLTETGKAQAKRGGKKAAAAGQRFDLILTSPLVRARETAEIIAAAIGYPPDQIVVHDDLIELQFGILEGTPWNAWWDLGHSYADLAQVEDAESIEQLQQRAGRVLKYLKNLPQDDVLAVGHSAFGRALSRAIHGQPYTDEFTHGTSLPHAEILQLI